ncbi:anaerobic ribonucleoside-triphosphate reductase [Fibrobacterales bacterium]|nr:anaerobic ribonucleoside-triphosphate reductase [Fibrobacterales bacterium]
MQATIKNTTPKITLKDEERQGCEIWTRVMGYHRPKSSFNPGKQSEFEERTYFDTQKCS